MDNSTLRCGCGNQLYISQAALVEVVAAFCRIAREVPPRLDIVTRDLIIQAFRLDVTNEYAVVPVTSVVYTRGADLCRTHRLRAYDAIQLVCGLAVRDRAIADGVAAPNFVCADAGLLAVAAAEGLTTEDPNTHP